MDTSLIKNWRCPSFLLLPKKSELPKIWGAAAPLAPPPPSPAGAPMIDFIVLIIFFLYPESWWRLLFRDTCFYVLVCKRERLLTILLLSIKCIFNPTFELATLNLGIEKCCHLRENNSKPSLWSLDLQDHRQHSSYRVFLQVIDHLDIDKGKSHLVDV